MAAGTTWNFIGPMFNWKIQRRGEFCGCVKEGDVCWWNFEEFDDIYSEWDGNFLERERCKMLKLMMTFLRTRGGHRKLLNQVGCCYVELTNLPGPFTFLKMCVFGPSLPPSPCLFLIPFILFLTQLLIVTITIILIELRLNNIVSLLSYLYYINSLLKKISFNKVFNINIINFY